MRSQKCVRREQSQECCYVRSSSKLLYFGLNEHVNYSNSFVNVKRIFFLKITSLYFFCNLVKWKFFLSAIGYNNLGKMCLSNVIHIFINVDSILTLYSTTSSHFQNTDLKAFQNYNY